MFSILSTITNLPFFPIAAVLLAATLFILAIIGLIKELKVASSPNSPITHFATWLGKAMEESPGEPSSLRFNVTNIGVQWTTAITIGFFISLFQNPTIIIAYLGVMASALSAAFITKAWQRGKEN